MITDDCAEKRRCKAIFTQSLTQYMETWWSDSIRIWGTFCALSQQAREIGWRAVFAGLFARRLQWMINMDSGNTPEGCTLSHSMFVRFYLHCCVTFTRFWFIVGPPSTTLVQHQTKIGCRSFAGWAVSWTRRRLRKPGIPGIWPFKIEVLHNL